MFAVVRALTARLLFLVSLIVVLLLVSSLAWMAREFQQLPTSGDPSTGAGRPLSEWDAIPKHRPDPERNPHYVDN